MTYPVLHHLGFKIISCCFIFYTTGYMSLSTKIKLENQKIKLENQKILNEIKYVLQNRNRLQ